MILLDTNVVSELMRNASATAVERWYVRCETETALPVIVLVELAYGIDRLPVGAKQEGLAGRLADWRARYARRIIPFGEAAALRTGQVLAAAEAGGRAMSFPDAQIAAMALIEGAKVATRDVRDFEPSGVAVVNPWVM